MKRGAVGKGCDLLRELPYLNGLARYLCGDPHRAAAAIRSAIADTWTLRDQVRFGAALRPWLASRLRHHLARDVPHELPDAWREFFECARISTLTPRQRIALRFASRLPDGAALRKLRLRPLRRLQPDGGLAKRASESRPDHT